jgi:hypothetical protein
LSPRFLPFAIASTLCGCTTLPPPRPFAVEQIHDSGGVAYLWTAGKARQPTLSMLDYAVVIGIDNQALPSEYRPSAGYEPFGAWRMEVPVGRHVVQVLDKEQTFAFIPVYLAQPLVMEHESRLVEFTAEAGRAYRPFAADKCGRKWIWIADEGPAAREDPNPKPLVFTAGLPTVGGESPPEDSC